MSHHQQITIRSHDGQERTATMRLTCPNRATDIRSYHIFGLRSDELRRATICRRPEGHRGPCLHYPNIPPAPLRLPEVTRAALTIPVIGHP